MPALGHTRQHPGNRQLSRRQAEKYQFHVISCVSPERNKPGVASPRQSCFKGKTLAHSNSPLYFMQNQAAGSQRGLVRIKG
jgi:hypothetical protein